MNRLPNIALVALLGLGSLGASPIAIAAAAAATATATETATETTGAGSPESKSIQPDDEWDVSIAQDQGVSKQRFDQMVATIESDPMFAHAYALLVVRHGALVGEAYFNGRRPEQTADVRSVTKSVTSMAMGIAQGRGQLGSELQPLSRLLPDYAPLLTGPKAAITLRDVLTMQAGLAWDDTSPAYLDQLFGAPDLVDYVLSEPLVATPGTDFTYSSGLSQVLAKVLIEATGQELSDYTSDNLLKPLGITNFGWKRRPNQGSKQGDHFGGLGIELRPRDMAKLGQLVLQDGSWLGNQILSRPWMYSATADQTAQNQGYGYQWWVTTRELIAIGYGGQYIVIDEDEDLLVVLQVDYNVPANRGIAWTSVRNLAQPLRDDLVRLDGGTVSGSESFRVVEGAGTAQVTLERNPSSAGASEGRLEVGYRTRSSTAASRRDFTFASGSLVWDSGEIGPKSLVVEVLQDLQQESDEELLVEFTLLTGAGRLETDRISVTIEDDDSNSGRSLLAFNSTESAAAEGDALGVVVERLQGTGAVEARIVIDQVTSSDEDWVAPLALEYDLSWDAGDTSSRSIQFDLAIDSLDEGTEIAVARLEVLTPGSEVDGSRNEKVLTLADSVSAPCSTPDLCLQSGRFRVETTWRNQRLVGDQGIGTATSLSDESGWFWFFDSDRLELLVKVLDGQGINDAFWTFYGGLSDVEYFLTLTDLNTRAVRTYWNRPGEICSGSDINAFPRINTEARGGLSSSAQWPPLQSPAVQLGPTSGPTAILLPRTQLGSTQMMSAQMMSTQTSAEPQSRDQPAAICGDEDELCLLNRFAIHVDWSDPRSGNSGRAVPVELTSETGLFWFFAESNIELAVKMVDGRSLNESFWIFTGALTDVEFTVAATDTMTGETETWASQAGDVCGFADTAAFPEQP